jgi:RimJ/RimL family protein N-acetyltransferase
LSNGPRTARVPWSAAWLGDGMEPVEIPAGRLHLRPWVPSDAGAVFRICQDSDIQRWTRVPSPYSREDAVGYVSQLSPAQWESGDGAPFAVLDSTTGDVLASVGFVGFSRQDAMAEIGYWCAAEARGRGITAQAVGAVCRWGFAAQGLARVEWLAEVGNTASRRVAEKAGFTVEGTLRARLTSRTGQADAWVGSLLPSDPSPV